ncbi:ABC-type multidrug transport system fused ATPase/permease subunit [Lachnotalea glycerini]|uniref:ABC-type multidrug transport system fused ATPase/permease subunit n=1 Tax=Lachnotalea glycerini TaxID=1763509 RepID=A0A318ERM6_9FIRM|nr:ABC transporter ATP-binding protein [Lachnotalea glycerini]PXV93388.1 ABC-type multidrug transport system fused ATPase/permease subunit [Lachnotalea glycerini]
MNKSDFKKIKKIFGMDSIKKINVFSLLALLTIATTGMPLITVDLINTITEAANMNELIKYILMYFIVSIINIVLESIFDVYYSIKEFDFTQNLKLKTIESMFLLRGTFFNEEKTGNLYTCVEDDTGKVAEFIYRVYSVLASFIQAIALLGVLIYSDWRLAIMLIAMIPIVTISQNLYGKKLKDKAEKNRVDYGDNNALTEEFVSNAPAMIMFGIKKSFMKKYKISLSKLRKSFKNLMITNVFANQTLQASTTVGLILITGYGGYEVFEKKISIGVLVIFIQYCSRFIAPLENVIMLKVSYNMIRPSLNRVYDILVQNDGIMNENKEKVISEIRLENVSFGYKQNQLVLNKIMLNFTKNKKYLICGKSGIGKSTIINLILGYWKPEAGKIIMNGKDLETLNIEEVRANISIVSQKTFFLHDTIYNNLANFENNYDENQLWNVLRKVGMYDEIISMSEGLSTIIGDDGMTLSGGQRQRLAIARALLKKSDVIIFDEPTSALDKKTEQIIVETIESINDKIVIIVSHSNSFSSIVDKIYAMDKENTLL